jgi:hypothetical protein
MKTLEIDPQYYFRQITGSMTMLTAIFRGPARVECPASCVRDSGLAASTSSQPRRFVARPLRLRRVPEESRAIARETGNFL